MKKKVVPKLRQKVKVKVDIVTSDDIKIYYIGKFQDFNARYIKKMAFLLCLQLLVRLPGLVQQTMPSTGYHQTISTGFLQIGMLRQVS